MTEKSEEELENERLAVQAMRNAKANMESALSRISTLETALSDARCRLQRFKGFVPTDAYNYGGKSRLHEEMDEAILTIAKVLAGKKQ